MSEWWRGCVVYQIYPRSFMDSNGDGVGDLAGIQQKLDYVASLGVDAIWISPFFKSPMKDFGYDVSDYRDVDPVFGSLDDFKAVLNKAHDLGLKVLIDQVWSHTSDQHDWFKESRQNKDNSKADWYVWKDPQPDGTAPNNWLSYFGGPAWTWDSRREQYYLHHFLKEQPSLNYWCPEVREAIKRTAAFWLDMGVDGFRLDVAHAYVCDPQHRSNPARLPDEPYPTDVPASNPMARQKRLYSMDVPENIEWIEELGAFISQWPDRCLLAEAGGDDSERTAARYTQGGKRFSMAYSFGLVGTTMAHQDIIRAVSRVENLIGDGWVCWATSNHDFKRVASRLEGDAPLQDKAFFATILGLCLRGSYCLYQGEELGLPQAELAFEDLQDPYDIMLYPEHVGRDGCRTPMPWLSGGSQAGFSTARKTWLPIPPAHMGLAVDLQQGDEQSVLSRLREFLLWRKQNDVLRTGDLGVINVAAPFIALQRTKGEEAYICLFNASAEEQGIDLQKCGIAQAEETFSYQVAKEADQLRFKGFACAIYKV
ncbi:MAG: alpha-amylase family glycosyl hydrolase [Micavibrio sp.]